MKTSKFVLAATIGLAVAVVGLILLHAVVLAIRESGADLPLWPRAGTYTVVVTLGYLLHSSWFLQPMSKKAVIGRLLMSAFAVPYAAMSIFLVCEFYFGEEELRQAARSKAVAEARELQEENRLLIDKRTRHVDTLKSKLDQERGTQVREKLKLEISLAELELLMPLPEAPRPGIDITNELAKLWGTTPREYVLYNALATGVVLVLSPYVLLSCAAAMWPRPSESQGTQSSANQGTMRTELQRLQPVSAPSTPVPPERSSSTRTSSSIPNFARAVGSNTTSRRKRRSGPVKNIEPCGRHFGAKTSASSSSQRRRKPRVSTVGPNDLQPASIPTQLPSSQTERPRALVAELDNDCGRPRLRKHSSSPKNQTFDVTLIRTAVWISATGTAGFSDCIGYWSRGPPAPLPS